MSFQEVCKLLRFSLDNGVENEQSDVTAAYQNMVSRISANSLRVTTSTAPLIYDSVSRVLARLEIHQTPEVFIVNEESTNAMVFSPGLHDKLVIVIHSGLIRLMERNELDFVIAHEMGHCGFQHGNVGGAEGPHSELGVLRKHAVSRYQELSADRIGLLGVSSINIAAKVMMKLASGLSSEHLGIDASAFMRQIENPENSEYSGWTLHSSHPSFPLRLWSLIQFCQSTEYSSVSGKGPHGIRLSEIDTLIAERLNREGDGALNETEDEYYSSAILWACMVMILADDKVEQDEHLALVKLVGSPLANKAIKFVAAQGKAAAQSKYIDAINKLHDASEATQMKYIRTIARFGEIINVDVDDLTNIL